MSSNKPNFIGFGAFQNSNLSFQIPTNPNIGNNNNNNNNNSVGNNSKFKVSPSYEGHNREIAQNFNWITSKSKDPKSKIRALQELSKLAFTSKLSNGESLQTLRYLCYLIERVGYDNRANIRRQFVLTMHRARIVLPKAFDVLTKQNFTYIGVLYSLQFDPVKEVQSAAVEMFQGYNELDKGEVLRYMFHVLDNYSRPSVLAALNHWKDNDDGNNGPGANSDDERFERVVTSVLVALSEIVKDENYRILVKVGKFDLVWKHFSSQRVAFRRASYQLVISLCAHMPETISSNTKLFQLIDGVVSSEKHPSNIPTVLEMVAIYLSTIVNKTSCEQKSNFNRLTKSVCKYFRKACFGSPADKWAPIVLPLSANCPRTTGSLSHQCLILQALWVGLPLYIIEKEKIEVVTAILETTTYLLVRRASDEEKHDISNIDEIFGMLVKVFKLYLQTQHPTSRLTNVVARDMSRIFSPATESIMSHISKSVWTDQVTKDIFQESLTSPCSLTLIQNTRRILQLVDTKSIDTGMFLSWCKIISQHILLSKKGNSLTLEEAEFLYEALNFENPLSILDVTEIEGLCVNQILFWIISCNVRDGSATSVDLKTAIFLFRIVQLLLTYVPSVTRQGVIFETILKEIERSGCSISLLYYYISTISQKGEIVSSRNILRCSTLNSLGLKIGQIAAQIPMDNEIDSKEVFEFLSFITNSRGKSLDVFINQITMDELAELVIDDNTNTSSILFHVFADMVLAASYPNTSLLHDIIVKTWREGGKMWESKIVPFLVSYHNDIIHQDVQHSALEYLKSDLSAPINTHLQQHSSSKKWAKQAWRYFQMINMPNVFVGSLSCLELIVTMHGKPAVDILGLNSDGLWLNEIQSSIKYNHPSYPFLCLVEFLDILQDERSKFMFVNPYSNGDENNYLVASLLITAASSEDQIRYGQIQPLQTESLINRIGKESIVSDTFLKAFCLRAIESLAQKDENLLGPVIIVLDVLLGLRFGEVECFDASSVNPAAIKEGDIYLYKSNEEDREVVITKIHRDDFPSLYFTISETMTGKERQTVASRLQHYKEEKYKANPFRVEIELMLVESLESVTDADMSLYTAEIYNVIICHLGLQGKPGIGSPRFNVHRRVSHIINDLITTISQLIDKPSIEGDVDPEIELMVSKSLHLFKCLNMSMGGGRLSRKMYTNYSILRIDPVPLVNIIFNLYDTKEIYVSSSRLFGFAVLEFIWHSVKCIKQDSSLRKIVALLNLLVPNLLRSDLFLEVDTEFIICSIQSLFKAVEFVKKQGISIGIADWNDDSVKIKFTPSVLNAYLEVPSNSDLDVQMTGFIKEKSNQNGLIDACATNIEKLYDLLFDPSRRIIGLWLISQAAGRGKALFPIEVTYSGSIFDQISCLTEDEIEDFEMDTHVAARYLPVRLIDIVEGFGKEDGKISPFNEMLSWITLLRFVQGVTNDSTIFNAISNYIRATNAVNYILSLIIDRMSFNNKDKSWKTIFDDIFEGIPTIEDYDVSKLAAYSFYLTVQVLPNLSKQWFTDECPRGKQKIVSNFVECHVAPETLKKQLENIQVSLSSLGDMVINGSCISREVIATYVQDEMQLSVVIKIPPNFPFKNVEVDANKTLGVPEKRYRRWALQIMRMLNTEEGGSILDALLLWKNNVDREYEGVEPCPVCYAVIDPKSRKMPTLECKTCSNRFHGACLSKWFQTSGKSQCVLCQQPWSGIDITRRKSKAQ